MKTYMLLTSVKLEISDWIQIGSIIASVVMSAVALWVSYKANKIAIQATKDNNRMIEETLRPEITLYPLVYLNSDPYLVLIIKNIGSSSCTITDLKSDFDFIKNKFYIEDYQDDLLKDIIGMTLGPDQSRMIHLNRLNTPEHPVTFTYSYTSSIKVYNETQVINFRSSTKLPIINASTKDRELKHIYHTLLEMLWKSF